MGWNVCVLSAFLSFSKFACREPRPILDSTGKVCAVLCGRPSGQRYREAADAAYQAMLHAADKTSFNKKEKNHRRGNFPALNIGITHGMGLDAPQFLKTEPHTNPGR